MTHEDLGVKEQGMGQQHKDTTPGTQEPKTICCNIQQHQSRAFSTPAEKQSDRAQVYGTVDSESFAQSGQSEDSKLTNSFPPKNQGQAAPQPT